MALPVLTNAKRYIKYGRTKDAVRRRIVNVTLFGVPNVWLHILAAPRFKVWEARVRRHEAEWNLSPWKPHRIDSWVWRTTRNGKGRSLHSFGVAIDIDPTTNPYGGTKTDIPLYVTNRARLSGITWGGKWRKPDPMHFEWRR